MSTLLFSIFIGRSFYVVPFHHISATPHPPPRPTLPLSLGSPASACAPSSVTL